MSKVQGHQAALLITALTRKAAAAVSVGTYRRGKLLLRCGVLGGASAPTEGGEGWGHILAAARLQLVKRC